MRARSSRRFRASIFVTAGVAIIGVLTACSTTEPTATPAVTSPSTSTAAPAESAAPPSLDAQGNAAANLDYFVASVKSLLDSAPDSSGRDIIDHLVAAGFDKAQMEVTPDTTAVGLDADNIDFSVRMNGDCLVGQTGIVGFHALAAPLLSTGTCLAGKTRTIDW